MCRTPFRKHADYIVRLLSGRIMRGGILIVGSLLWDRRRERDEWRQARLRIDDAVHVRVPIRYGRCSGSRGDTFTMTFAGDGKLGQGVLVPCRTSVVDAAALLAEATDLWKAEQPSAPTESIGASWGCVGVLFRSQGAPDERFEAWSHYFRRKSSPFPLWTAWACSGFRGRCSPQTVQQLSWTLFSRRPRRLTRRARSLRILPMHG